MNKLTIQPKPVEVKKTKKAIKPKVKKPYKRRESRAGVQLKPKIYELYVVWKSLPPMMTNPVKGTVDEVMEKLGIDDPLLIEMANIRTMTAFAEKFGVNRETLRQWNGLINKRDTLADIRIWAKLLTKNVMLSMYNNATMKGGTSFKDRENYMKIIERWSDKLNLEHSVDTNLADILKSSISKKKNDTGNTTRQHADTTSAN